MQQWYQCPRCGKNILYGTNPCPYCKCSLAWSQQGPILYIPPPGAPQQPPPQYQQPPPQYQQQYQQPQQPGGVYQQQYQQQAPPNYQQASSICVKCQYQNNHGVDHNGEATVRCQSCSTVYSVKTYEVRTTRGRRDRKSGIKSYEVRVKEPDRDERLLEFDSAQDIEMRAGDWIIGSYSRGKLKYLFNEKIKHYWDVQSGMGCMTVFLMFAALVTTVIIPLVCWL